MAKRKKSESYKRRKNREYQRAYQARRRAKRKETMYPSACTCTHCKQAAAVGLIVNHGSYKTSAQLATNEVNHIDIDKNQS